MEQCVLTRELIWFWRKNYANADFLFTAIFKYSLRFEAKQRGWHKTTPTTTTKRSLGRHCWIIYKVIITYFKHTLKKNCNSKLPWVKVEWNTCYLNMTWLGKWQKKRIYKVSPKNWMSPENTCKAILLSCYACFGFVSLFSLLLGCFWRVFTIMLNALPWITWR